MTDDVVVALEVFALVVTVRLGLFGLLKLLHPYAFHKKKQP